jgi:cytochrome c peroxidase
MQTVQCIKGVGMVTVAVASISLVAATVLGDDDTLREEAKALFGVIESARDASIGAPDAVLGRALFWDERISADGKTSCASCHRLEDYGGDRRVVSRRATGKMTKRNSQTVFNSMRQPSLRWTGNRKSGAEQAERSITGSMGLASREAAVQLLTELGYEAAFRTAFPNDPEPVSTANYGRAIEAYEDTLMTPAAFDKFLAGDNDALTVQQKTGLTTFIEIGCADCHSGALFGGSSMEKFGVEKAYWTATGSKEVGMGRFEDTQEEADRHVFRVPMLRNIAKTGPYFHDGSVPLLADAVQVMADVQLGDRLSADDETSIVEFLMSLTGQIPEHFSPPPTDPPVAVRIVPAEPALSLAGERTTTNGNPELDESTDLTRAELVDRAFAEWME